jgi:hypothetical protein
MATLTYRCQVSPDQCPTSPGPGFCVNHRTSPLRPERRRVPPPPGTEPGGDQEPMPEPDQLEQPGPQRLQVALRLLGQLLELPPEGLELGRDAPRCASLPGLSDLHQVSRRHARVDWRGNVPFISDLQSRNGTYVNGERVTEPRPLLPGQTLRLGLDVEVQVVELDLDEYGLPL